MELSNLEEQLEALCDVFQDELDRQETLLSLTRSQGQAALMHDVEMIEAKTEAIQNLIRDAKEAEETRVRLVGQVVDSLRLPHEQQTLTHLIAASPEPWKRRMAEFQVRLREVLEDTRLAVRSNNLVMRRSLQIVNEALGVLVACVPASRGQYDARGEAAAAGVGSAAILDRKG